MDRRSSGESIFMSWCPSSSKGEVASDMSVLITRFVHGLHRQLHRSGGQSGLAAAVDDVMDSVASSVALLFCWQVLGKMGNGLLEKHVVEMEVACGQPPVLCFDECRA